MGGRRSASFKPFALKLERGRRAEAMHNSGFTYEQIGTALNVSAMSAWRWVQFCADWDARGREPNGRRSRKIPRSGTLAASPRRLSAFAGLAAAVSCRLRAAGRRGTSAGWRPTAPGARTAGSITRGAARAALAAAGHPSAASPSSSPRRSSAGSPGRWRPGGRAAPPRTAAAAPGRTSST